MADVGDENNSNDAPTAPFPKIVPSDDDTVVFRWDRLPGAPEAGPESPREDSAATVPAFKAVTPKPAATPPPEISGPVRVGTGPEPEPPESPPPAVPAPRPSPKGGLLSLIGDIPMRVVYLLGAIVATVAAVLLVFLIFSGDVPNKAGNDEDIVPVPAVSADP